MGRDTSYPFIEERVTSDEFPGFRVLTKFGQNNDVDAQEDVWHGGGTYTGFSSAAETLLVSSGSLNDAAAGTGARTVRLYGLDASYEEITEDVTLNGTSQVETTQEFLRMNPAKVLTAGSGGFNAWDITAAQSSSGDIHMVMPANRNQTHIAAYTIPAGWYGVMKRIRWDIHRESGGTVDREASVDTLVREYGEVFQSKRPVTLSNFHFVELNIFGGIYLPPRSDIVQRVWTVSAANSVVSSSFALLLVKTNDT